MGRKTWLAVRLGLAGTLATLAVLDAAHGRDATILGMQVLPPNALAVVGPDVCQGVGPSYIKPIDPDGPRPGRRGVGCE